MSTEPVTVTITKDTIKRLLKDVTQIMKNPLTDNGIYYVHDDEDILKGYAMIVGTSDTPYFGGFYFFKFKFTPDYPYSPPILTYCTNDGRIRFNPNLYKDGKVCISILNTWRGEQWSSCQTITTILLTLCTVLCKNPLLNEPGVFENHPECNIYSSIIEYNNIKVAICQMIEKNKNAFDNEFLVFYPYMKDIFLKNYDVILEFLKNKKNISPQNLSIQLYKLNSLIDYPNLYIHFMNCKTLLNS
jgi:ubiquitin-conjugating enzyme E2 Z